MEAKRRVLTNGKHEFLFGKDICLHCGAPFQAFVEGATQTCPVKQETILYWRKNRDAFKVQEVHA